MMRWKIQIFWTVILLGVAQVAFLIYMASR